MNISGKEIADPRVLTAIQQSVVEQTLLNRHISILISLYESTARQRPPLTSTHLCQLPVYSRLL